MCSSLGPAGNRVFFAGTLCSSSAACRACVGGSYLCFPLSVVLKFVRLSLIWVHPFVYVLAATCLFFWGSQMFWPRVINRLLHFSSNLLCLGGLCQLSLLFLCACTFPVMWRHRPLLSWTDFFCVLLLLSWTNFFRSLCSLPPLVLSISLFGGASLLRYDAFSLLLVLALSCSPLIALCFFFVGSPPFVVLLCLASRPVQSI